VPLAEAPLLKVLVGDADSVVERLAVVEPLSVPLGVCEEVCVDVLVPLEVDELVAVTDKLIDEEGESVPLSVPLNDGNAPIVTEEVGD
jgi:hypothetical protein